MLYLLLILEKNQKSSDFPFDTELPIRAVCVEDVDEDLICGAKNVALSSKAPLHVQRLVERYHKKPILTDQVEHVSRSGRITIRYRTVK